LRTGWFITLIALHSFLKINLIRDANKIQSKGRTFSVMARRVLTSTAYYGIASGFNLIVISITWFFGRPDFIGAISTREYAVMTVQLVLGLLVIHVLYNLAKLSRFRSLNDSGKIASAFVFSVDLLSLGLYTLIFWSYLQEALTSGFLVSELYDKI
jgi:hypothetical protein